ncbi:MAG: XRE family transcriptional regulator [Cytophagaceae bacterium]|nr:MAG: XRE family transcriptional regulator [Cytophagaceae bacterium]
MDIKDIRRFRLKKLVLTLFGGKQSAFADAIGRSASYVARLFSDSPEHSRNIGEVLARDIERICGVPPGFLDQPLTKVELLGAYDPTTNPPPRSGHGSERSVQEVSPGYQDHYEQVSLPVIDIPDGLRLGERMADVEMVARGLTLDSAWLRRTLSYSDLSNLRIVTGAGQSMTPTIKHGDLLIVDQSVTSVYDDGIYVCIIGSALAIKRIQRQPDGITVISDNPRYKEIFVPDEMEEKVRVIGKVL